MSAEEKYAAGLVQSLGRYGIGISGKKILDVGGGDGVCGLYLQKNNAEVYIVDPYPGQGALGVTEVFSSTVEELFDSDDGNQHKGTFDLVIISALVKVEKLAGKLVTLNESEWRQVITSSLGALKEGGEIFIAHTDVDHTKTVYSMQGVIEGKYISGSRIAEILQELDPQRKVIHTEVMESILKPTVRMYGVPKAEKANRYEMKNGHFIVGSTREIEVQDGLAEEKKQGERKKAEESRLKRARDEARKREKEAKRKNKK